MVSLHLKTLTGTPPNPLFPGPLTTTCRPWAEDPFASRLVLRTGSEATEASSTVCSPTGQGPALPWWLDGRTGRKERQKPSKSLRMFLTLALTVKA